MTTSLDDYINPIKKWHERVHIMALFHYSQNMNSSLPWTVDDTADYFKISSSTVSENLQIAAKLPELRNIGSRNKALKRIRGLI